MVKFIQFLLVVFVVIPVCVFILGAIFSSGTDNAFANNSNSRQAITVTAKIMYACKDRGLILKANTLYKSGDSSAGGNYLLSNAVQGNCVIMQKGEKFYILQNRQGIIKVRKEGDYNEYYTLHSAFK